MPDEQTQVRDTTTYQVLEKVDVVEVVGQEGEHQAWIEVGGPVTVDAGQKRKAIKAATADRDDEAKRGTFVAVAVGSWTPEQRGVELKDTWS